MEDFIGEKSLISIWKIKYKDLKPSMLVHQAEGLIKTCKASSGTLYKIIKLDVKWTMFWVFALPLGQNCGVRPAADKNFCLQLMIEKMRAFGVLTKKYLQQYGCCDTNFRPAINCTYPNTEIRSGIIEIQNH